MPRAIRTLDRKLLRDLWEMKGQALAIVAVVAAGVTMFVTYLSNFSSLQQTRAEYYETARFADVFASLKRAPKIVQARLEQIPGVERVMTRVVADVTLDVPGMSEPATGRLVSLPERGRPPLNDVYLRRGRWVDPARADEVLASEMFCEAHGFGPGDRVAALTDYDQDDIDMLDMVARRIWSVASQRRILEHYLDIEARHRQMQSAVSVCGLEYDVDEDVLTCDSMFAEVFGLSAFEAPPVTQQQFLHYIERGDRQRAAEALGSESPDVRTVRVTGLRPDGTTFPAELGLEFRAREIGSGLIANGTIRDLTGEVAVESLRKRADTDPLTGLPNRNVLARLGEAAADRRRLSPGVAFHYVDLDRFKPVNDTYGHLLGDEVLRIVAERLRAATRQGDTVIRMGGDEFAVVQANVHDQASALVLADAIVETLGQPIIAHGRSVRVGASVGIALSAGGTASLRELSEAADRALYQAKALGGSRSLIAGSWDTSS